VRRELHVDELRTLFDIFVLFFGGKMRRPTSQDPSAQGIKTSTLLLRRRMPPPPPRFRQQIQHQTPNQNQITE
jgi:hypothetical protein